jgi:2-keto-4-pentenoate hydratase/2-oxohepta-3-ene-1,7-dioic acid hydratase in catechol pathway
VVKQDRTTSDVILGVPEMPSFHAWSFTLQPGDVILA